MKANEITHGAKVQIIGFEKYNGKTGFGTVVDSTPNDWERVKVRLAVDTRDGWSDFGDCGYYLPTELKKA
jgi:hypothetical protein